MGRSKNRKVFKKTTDKILNVNTTDYDLNEMISWSGMLFYEYKLNIVMICCYPETLGFQLQINEMSKIKEMFESYSVGS